MDFPAVLIRTSTERPEVLDKGSIVIGGITKRTVCQALELAVYMFTRKEKSTLLREYREQIVSQKVVAIIQSYRDIVNRIVWRK